MGWVKLEDRYRSHPKMAQAGEAALALDVCGMCFCREHGTDGFIPDATLRLLGPIRNPERAAKALVVVGRWERDDNVGGYWIHDFTEYNPTDEADRIAAEERREKARRAARARWTKDAHSNAPSNAQASDEQCPDDAPSNAPPMPPSPPSSKPPLTPPPSGGEPASSPRAKGTNLRAQDAKRKADTDAFMARRNAVDAAATYGRRMAVVMRGRELLAALRRNYGDDRELRLMALVACRATRRELEAA